MSPQHAPSLKYVCVNCFLISRCSTVINTMFHHNVREVPYCAVALIREMCRTVSQHVTSLCVSSRVTRPHGLHYFQQTLLPPTYFTLLPPSVQYLPAHTCIITSLMPNRYIPIYRHLPSLVSIFSVSLCIHGLLAALISAIRAYVLIGVNTKVGVGGEQFTLQL